MTTMAHVSMRKRQRSARSVFAQALIALAMAAALLIPVAGTADASGSGCPSWSIEGVLADLDGDWDHDRVSNGDEVFHLSLNPCKNDSGELCRTGSAYCRPKKVHVYNLPYHYGAHHYSPCSHGVYSAADIGAAPYGDWDGDGVANLVEVNQGTNPCHRDHHYAYVVVYVPNPQPKPQPGPGRLPHLGGPEPQPQVIVPSTPVPVNPCPAGYPYYHPGNGKCYANPVNTPLGW